MIGLPTRLETKKHAVTACVNGHKRTAGMIENDETRGPAYSIRFLRKVVAQDHDIRVANNRFKDTFAIGILIAKTEH